MSRPKHLLLPLLERFLSRNEIRPDEVDLSKVKRVLVIRQHDMLGDFLLATPVFRALREILPGAAIAVVVRDYFVDTVRSHPRVDEILEIPKDLRKWTFHGFLRFMQQLRSNWDLVIVLNTVSHSVTSDLLAWLTNARWILGSDVYPFPGCRRNFFYNLIAASHTGVRHQSERNLDIVRYIGIDTRDLSEEIRVTETEVERARAALRQLTKRTEHHLLIGVHIGAGKIANRWPIRSFSSLMERLSGSIDASFFVFWGPKEDSLAEELRRMIRFQPTFIPPSSVRQLAAYFAACNLVVCNDTGSMHICASVGTPLVALFGPTPPEEWNPVGANFVAVRGSNNRVESVSVEEVLSLVVESVRRHP